MSSRSQRSRTRVKNLSGRAAMVKRDGEKGNTRAREIGETNEGAAATICHLSGGRERKRTQRSEKKWSTTALDQRNGR